jgi:hypothetical protein
VGVVSLPPSSAPATGSAAQHAADHKDILDRAIP